MKVTDSAPCTTYWVGTVSYSHWVNSTFLPGTFFRRSWHTTMKRTKAKISVEELPVPFMFFLNRFWYSYCYLGAMQTSKGGTRYFHINTEKKACLAQRKKEITSLKLAWSRLALFEVVYILIEDCYLISKLKEVIKLSLGTEDQARIFNQMTLHIRWILGFETWF